MRRYLTIGIVVLIVLLVGGLYISINELKKTQAKYEKAIANLKAYEEELQADPVA